jgi:hypothetical protein
VRFHSSVQYRRTVGSLGSAAGRLDSHALGESPYGPWSKGELAFPVNDGLGKFMHLPGADHTQEGFGADRSADLAGMYGPTRSLNITAGLPKECKSTSRCPAGTHIR